MYNTAYNQKIAHEVEHINKRFINHEEAKDQQPMAGRGVSGGGVSGGRGQKEYIKNQADICKNCEGSGLSGGWGISIGFGKPKRRVGRPSKESQEAESLEEEHLKGGWGISVGFGKKKRGRPSKAEKEHKEAEQLKQEHMKGGWGISVGFGKKKHHPKEPERKNVKGGWSISVGFGKKKHPEPTKKRGNPGLQKRAEIVKQVMAEQGLSMIEASRYVKAHDLY